MSPTATPALQFPAEGAIPGNKGIWAGILSEMTEFALLFGVYFIARAHFPQEFRDGPLRLSLFAGTFNTVLMISGSYFVANAVLAIRQNRQQASIRWLLLVLIAACGYLVTKFFEFRWNVSQGVTGGTGIFFAVYYYLTFTHIVHVVWGITGLLWVIVRTHTGAYSPQNHEGMEAFASYWHATDLVWLIIFPLLYLLR
ncbi:MAG: cytochrome c oxidase subunit 3 family protein [Sulfuricella sp.]|nr:cytochrome c oxidase subunit 3 family protein [Sulfuricella sp.]